MPSAITGPTAPAAPYTGATTDQVTRPDQMNQDTFLKLLVAQLRNQDPSKPADPAQFISQSATFSSVSKLEELVKQNGAAALTQKVVSAGAMVGKTAVFTTSDGTPGRGVIESVAVSGSEPVATIGGVQVPMSQIQTLSK